MSLVWLAGSEATLPFFKNAPDASTEEFGFSYQLDQFIAAQTLEP